MSQEDTTEGQAPEGSEETPAVKQTFDADYVKGLRAEAARHRKEAQEAKAEAQELKERDQSEVEKLTTKLTKAEQAKAEAEARLTRYEVAAEKQIPAEALDLLSGNTREELEAKADKILEFTSKTTEPPAPEFDGGAREPAPEPKTPAEAHNEFAALLLGPPGTPTQ